MKTDVEIKLGLFLQQDKRKMYLNFKLEVSCRSDVKLGF